MSSRMSALLILASLAAVAAEQPSEPPIAQVWIDLSTSSGNIPGIGAMSGGLSSLFGGKGKAEGNHFGNTRSMMGAGRWMDVTLMTRNNPNLQKATQAVPDGSKLAPTLALVSPEGTPPVQTKPTRQEEQEPAPEVQKPKGKMTLYWGCGSKVREGQPRVLDMATAGPADFQKFFESRRATTKGTHSTPGQPDWPNKDDSRMIPDDASLVGEHTFTGEGVPDGFKVNIDAAHDLMPAIELSNHDDETSTILDWKALEHARGYFIASMSSQGEGEMVVWTSSELPDFGFGLLDYQPNGAIDKWLKEKVLLAPTVTECAIPKEALGKGTMVRMIAYGNELDVAYPPRPKNPKQVWKPEWEAKVRLKSVSMTMLGMPGRAQDSNSKPPSPLNVLKGLFGH
ncbi:MAG: hypothetical protein JO218_07625 [Burkholderiales bacterium]|nr:hypothetical protein [Burkholderiales bacterium]